MWMVEGPKEIFDAVVSGNTDLFVIGNDVAGYGQAQIEQGIMRNFQPSAWNGRLILTSANDTTGSSSGVHTNIKSHANLTTREIEFYDAGGATDGAVGIAPVKYLELLPNADLAGGFWLLQSELSHEYTGDISRGIGGYSNGTLDPFVGNRIRTWPIFRSPPVGVAWALPSFRVRGYANTTALGSDWTTVTVNETDGITNGNINVYIDAADYTSYSYQGLELRYAPDTANNEIATALQIVGSGFSIVDAENTRTAGLFYGSFHGTSAGAATFNANISQTTWEQTLTACTSNADNIVFMIMLGFDNEDSGTFISNIETLISRLKAATLNSLNKTAKFILVAPWSTGTVPSDMNLTKNNNLLNLALTSTGISTVSLYNNYRQNPPRWVENSGSVLATTTTQCDDWCTRLWYMIVEGSSYNNLRGAGWGVRNVDAHIPAYLSDEERNSAVLTSKGWEIRCKGNDNPEAREVIVAGNFGGTSAIVDGMKIYEANYPLTKVLSGFLGTPIDPYFIEVFDLDSPLESNSITIAETSGLPSGLSIEKVSDPSYTGNLFRIVGTSIATSTSTIGITFSDGLGSLLFVTVATNITPKV